MKRDKMSFSRNGEKINVNYFSLFDSETMEYDQVSVNFDCKAFWTELERFQRKGVFSLTNKKQEKLKINKISDESYLMLELNNRSFIIKNSEVDAEKIKEEIYGF